MVKESCKKAGNPRTRSKKQDNLMRSPLAIRDTATVERISRYKSIQE